MKKSTRTGLQILLMILTLVVLSSVVWNIAYPVGYADRDYIVKLNYCGKIAKEMKFDSANLNYWKDECILTKCITVHSNIICQEYKLKIIESDI